MTIHNYRQGVRTSKKGSLFWYLGIENFLIGLSASLLGPLLPIISRDLNISFSKMGIILSLNSFGALIFVLAAGSVLEVFPNRIKKINELCCILITVSFGGIYFVRNFYNFSLFYFIFGLAVGGLIVVTTIILHDLYEMKISSILLSISLFSLIGFTIGPIMVSIFLNFNLNWRYLFILVAFLQIPIFIYLTFLKFRPKPNIDKKIGFLFHVNKKILLNKKVIAGFIISLLHGGISVVTFNWLTTFLMEIDIPVKTGSIFVVFFSISMIIASLSKIVLLKFMKENSIILFNSIASVIFIVLFFQTGSMVLRVIFLMLFGINVTGISTLAISLSVKALPAHKSSIAGIINAFAYIGAMVFQYTAGRLSDSYGSMSIAYLTLIGLVLLVVVSVFLQWVDKKQLTGRYCKKGNV